MNKKTHITHHEGMLGTGRFPPDGAGGPEPTAGICAAPLTGKALLMPEEFIVKPVIRICRR